MDSMSLQICLKTLELLSHKVTVSVFLRNALSNRGGPPEVGGQLKRRAWTWVLGHQLEE